jgi:hypothetical protein
MASNGSDTGLYSLAQIIVVLAGVQFGLVPLGKRIFGVSQDGLYNWVFGGLHLTDPLTYVVPAAVVVVALVVLGGLDAAKKRRA